MVGGSADHGTVVEVRPGRACGPLVHQSAWVVVYDHHPADHDDDHHHHHRVGDHDHLVEDHDRQVEDHDHDRVGDLDDGEGELERCPVDRTAPRRRSTPPPASSVTVNDITPT